MNQKRRAQLQRVVGSLQEIINDEQDAYDNMPENIQDSDKGDKIAEGLDELNEAKDILEERIT